MCSISGAGGGRAETLLGQAVDALASHDVTDLPDAVVRSQLLSLLITANRLHAELVRRVGVFDSRALAGEDGCRTARAWLRAFGHLSHHAAGALVRAARVLRQLPRLAQATSEGRVSAEHVGRVAKLVDRVGVAPVSEVDQILTDAAVAVDPAGLQQVCDRVRAHVDPDGSPPDGYRDFERRGITLSPCDGMLLVHGQLDPEGGATLMTALDAFTAPPADGDERSPAQRRADALVQVARDMLGSGRAPTVGGVRPHVGILLAPENLAPAGQPRDTSDPAARTMSAARHGPSPHRPPPHGTAQARDAIQVDDLTRAGGHADGGDHVQTSDPIQPRGPGRADAVATADDPVGAHAADEAGARSDPLATAGIPPAPPRAWLQWFGPVSDLVAQRVACDADVWRVVLDPANGLPVDVGRTRRLVPHWIRKALWARDRGCRFPGCHTPAPWADAHHLLAWAHDGPTNVDNLVLLCRYHHALVHEGGWTIQLDRDTGTVVANRPGGIPYQIPPSRPWIAPDSQAA
jgi:hypothetical protein